MMEASHIIMEVALLLFVIVSCTRKGFAVAAENNNGNDFIVAMFTHKSTCHPSLHFTGKEGTVIQVESPDPVHTFTNLTIGNTLSTTHDLNPEHCFDVKNTAIARKGFRIKSDDGISVSAVNIPDTRSGESYLVLPLSQLSTEYFAVSCPSTFEYSKLMVIASDDDTHINITVRTSSSICSGSNYNSGQDIKLNLNNMDVFGLFCTDDFTGTYIRSSKPIAVISGCHSTRGSISEPVAEMLIPAVMYGRSYILYTLAPRHNLVYRVVAAHRNTKIELAGQTKGIVHEGDYMDMEVTDAACLNSSETVLVVAFNKYFTYVENLMAVVQSTDHFMTSYLVDTNENPVAISTTVTIALVSSDPSTASTAADKGLVKRESQSACGFNVWQFGTKSVSLVDLHGSAPFGLLYIRKGLYIGMGYSGGFRNEYIEGTTSTNKPKISTAAATVSGLANSTEKNATVTTSAFVSVTTSPTTISESTITSTTSTAAVINDTKSSATTSPTASTMGPSHKSSPSTDSASTTTPDTANISVITSSTTITPTTSTFSVTTTTTTTTPTVQLDHNGQPVRTVREKCTCFCKPKHRLEALTPGALSEQKAHLQEKLQVKTTNLTSSISKKTSAPDRRTSSTGIGYLAVSCVMLPFILVMFADILNMVAAFIHMCRRKKI